MHCGNKYHRTTRRATRHPLEWTEDPRPCTAIICAWSQHAVYDIVFWSGKLCASFICRHVAFTFVAFVDAIDKSHRTTRCGNNTPAGMATNRKQRVDMRSMWRHGSLRHPVPPLRRLLIPRIRASVWEEPGHDQVRVQNCRVRESENLWPRPTASSRSPAPSAGRDEAQTLSPQASWCSNPIP